MIDENQVKVSVLDKDCMAPLSNEVTFSNQTLFSESEDGVLMISFEANTELLASTNSTFTFCAQVGVSNQDDNNLLEMEETKFTCSADLEVGFFVIESKIQKEEASKANETTTCAVDACPCHENQTCIDEPVLVQEQKYQVCIFAPAGMIIDSFMQLTLTQNDLKHDSIFDRQTDAYTTTQSGVVGLINSKLIAMFFVNSTLPDITIFGKVGLGFKRRFLGERARLDDAGSDDTDGSFAMKVHLMKESGFGDKDNEEAEADKNMKGLFLIVAGAVGVAFVRYGGMFIIYKAKK